MATRTVSMGGRRRNRCFQLTVLIIASELLCLQRTIGFAYALALTQLGRSKETTMLVSSVGKQDPRQQKERQGDTEVVPAPYKIMGNSDNRFASPLLEFGYPPAVQEFKEGLDSEKPLLLYIPGFDGTYLSAFFQYPELHTIFDVRCLVSSMDDRSTFDDLKQRILSFLLEGTEPTEPARPLVADASQQRSNTTNVPQVDSARTQSFPSNVFTNLWKRSNDSDKKRPVYLVGESFGGILALDVALSLMEDNSNHDDINLQGLVLVNAATCFDRSRLAAEGPPVASLPSMFYFFGILKLLPMFLDKISLPQFFLIVQGAALPSLIDNPMREAYMGRLAFALPSLLKYMPQETLQWRLEQWLSVGCKRMAKKLAALSRKQESLRTLIVAGENDLALPSIAEAERLAQLFSQNSHVHVVREVGHANTCGTCLDLTAEMRNHFPELQVPLRQQLSSQQTNSNNTDNNKKLNDDETDPPLLGRTRMKDEAAKGKGIYFGMEPRYDGKRIGLSPFSYWSQDYYQKVVGHSPR